MISKTISISLVLILTLSAFVLDFSSDDVEAGQIVDVVGKDMTFSLPGSGVRHTFWILPGDNITMTIWNYSGPEGRATVMGFGFADYYEKSNTFTTTGLSADFNIVTGRTYVFWAIVPVPGTMTITFDMYNDNTALSCEYNITRKSSDYSPDDFIREVIEREVFGINENVTSCLLYTSPSPRD